MTAAQFPAGAASHAELDWHAIHWRAVHENVRRLQARIVQATKEGRWGKVKAFLTDAGKDITIETIKYAVVHLFRFAS